MAYATIMHVTARAPQRVFSATSKPTATQVVQFIDECGGIIDAVLLQAGYEVPTSLANVATHTQLLLQNANAAGAAYHTEVAAPTSDSRRKEYEDMWGTALKMLRTMQLDLPKDASESNARQGAIASPPFFTRDMDL